MNKIKKTVTLLLFIMITSITMAGNKFVKIKTSAICGMCKNRIELTVSRLDGIKKAILDVKTKIIRIRYNDDVISIDEIKKAISDTGYDADDVAKNIESYNVLPGCCKLGSSCDANSH